MRSAENRGEEPEQRLSVQSKRAYPNAVGFCSTFSAYPSVRHAGTGDGDEAGSRGYPIVSSLACTERDPRKRKIPVCKKCARPFLARRRVTTVKVDLAPSSAHLLPTRALPTNI